MRGPLRKMLWKYYRGNNISGLLVITLHLLINLSFKFSEFTTKDYQELHGHHRGGQRLFRKWILFGADWVFMQGNSVYSCSTTFILNEIEFFPSTGQIRKFCKETFRIQSYTARSSPRRKRLSFYVSEYPRLQTLSNC